MKSSLSSSPIITPPPKVADHQLYPKQQKQKSPQILLVEDNETIASIMEYHLSRQNWKVDHCKNGLNALNLAQEKQFNLVILDIKIPKIDGLEVLRQLKDRPNYVHIPFIIMSSMGSDDYIVKGFENGAQDYIVKPFSPIALIARLKSHLNYRSKLEGSCVGI